ncbi:MAG: 1-acyl-sn-glycerol-3-phosphate acyltransferase [Actinomycetota bacterium]|nr:1-acyl-sn-glycerol-3-phosphate acyltransferase [Actinomycetota bacterium]
MASNEVGRLYPAAKAVITPLFRVSWRFDLKGLENIPDTGGAILCPNHTSVLDSFFVPALLPRRITYVGKAEYMDSWKTKHLFPALGMIPIDREGGDAAERALSAAERVLRQGELFGIYPEGTRSRDGRLYRGHTGPARLALRANVPIIPIGITGARDVMPPEARFPRLRLPVTVHFGEPISVARYADRSTDHRVLRQIIDEVMFAIRDLSGQEYVNEYAAKKKKPVEEMPADETPDVVGTEPLEPSVGANPTAEKANGRGPVPTGPDRVASGGHERAAKGSEDAENEFVRATDSRSSVDVLRRPVRRRT